MSWASKAGPTDTRPGAFRQAVISSRRSCILNERGNAMAISRYSRTMLCELVTELNARRPVSRFHPRAMLQWVDLVDGSQLLVARTGSAGPCPLLLARPASSIEAAVVVARPQPGQVARPEAIDRVVGQLQLAVVQIASNSNLTANDRKHPLGKAVAAAVLELLDPAYEVHERQLAAEQARESARMRSYVDLTRFAMHGGAPGLGR
jgi:hypothetical protein